MSQGIEHWCLHNGGTEWFGRVGIDYSCVVHLMAVKKGVEEKHERKWWFRPAKASQHLLPVNTQTILTIKGGAPLPLGGWRGGGICYQKKNCF